MALRTEKALKLPIFVLVVLIIFFALLSLVFLNVWKNLVFEQASSTAKKSLGVAAEAQQSDILTMTAATVRAQLNGDPPIHFHDIVTGTTVVVFSLLAVVLGTGMILPENQSLALKILCLVVAAIWTTLAATSSAYLIGRLYGRAYEIPVEEYKYQFFLSQPSRQLYRDLFVYLDRGQWVFPPLVAASAAMGFASVLCLLTVGILMVLNLRKGGSTDKRRVTFQEQQGLAAKEKISTWAI